MNLNVHFPLPLCNVLWFVLVFEWKLFWVCLIYHLFYFNFNKRNSLIYEFDKPLNINYLYLSYRKCVFNFDFELHNFLVYCKSKCYNALLKITTTFKQRSIINTFYHSLVWKLGFLKSWMSGSPRCVQAFEPIILIYKVSNH